MTGHPIEDVEALRQLSAVYARKMAFLRRHGGADSGKPHHPRRPKPTSAPQAS